MIDYIITNGFLSNIFAEHALVEGDANSKNQYTQCRINMGRALDRLPFFLPASRKVIAALALGVSKGVPAVASLDA